MNTFVKILCLACTLALLLSLCSCDKTPAPDNTDPSSEPTTQTTIPSAEATDPSAPEATGYKVTVVDEAGNPIVGALVQLCEGTTCVPAPTDANGVAVYDLEENDYKVSFLMLPAGFDYTSEETEFHFAEGSKELTIVLKAVG